MPEESRFAEWAATHGVSDPNGDDDGDGLINMIEFLSGLDPKVPASAAEREATQRRLEVREVDGRRFIRIELSIAEGAGYEALSGQLSPDLQAPWAEAEPSTMEVLGETGTGNATRGPRVRRARRNPRPFSQSSA